MSIPLSLKDFSDEEKEALADDLTVRETKKEKFGKKKKYYPGCDDNLITIEAFDVKNYNGEKSVFLPLNYAYTKYGNDIFITNEENFDCNFEGKLSNIQNEVQIEALHQLSEKRSTIISMQCGMGKTILSLYLISVLRQKTMVLVHRLTLIDQWIDAIKRFLPGAKYEVCTSSNVPSHDSEIYIMNMINVEKIYPERYEDVGIHVLIIDEVHVACALAMSRCLLYIFPDYLIGLSATPYRVDGLDKLLDIYFGTQKIIRRVKRPHIVYKISTGFEIQSETTKTGTLNWNSVIESQTNNDERNILIADIVRKFQDRVFIILCKLVRHVHILKKHIIKIEPNVDILCGTKQIYNKDARVLIATFSKCSVGFDHPKLNAMILATDVVQFEQTHGRIFRKVDTVPLFFDLVDKFKLLGDHWRERKKVYDEFGGSIEKYKLTIFRRKYLE